MAKEWLKADRQQDGVFTFMVAFIFELADRDGEIFFAYSILVGGWLRNQESFGLGAKITNNPPGRIV